MDGRLGGLDGGEGNRSELVVRLVGDSFGGVPTCDPAAGCEVVAAGLMPIRIGVAAADLDKRRGGGSITSVSGTSGTEDVASDGITPDKLG